MDHHQLAGLDLNLLVAFDALSETCSVTKAAARLGISQSAMSHTLKRLRDMLDDPILVRSGRTMLPTPTAQRLAVPVRGALNQLLEAIATKGRFDPRTTTRSFRIAGSDLVALTLIPEIAQRFREQAPHANLIVLQGMRTDTAALTRGELDLALYPRQDASSDLLHTPLVEHRFVGLVRAGHPVKRLTLKRYTELTHVLISPTGEGPGRVDIALAKHGLSRHVAARVAHFSPAPLLLAQSDLILTVPIRLARFAMAYASLRILELPIDLPSFTVDAIWHRRYDAEPTNRWLRTLVLEAATCFKTGE